MKGKAILLVRVSTEGQTYDEQARELRQLAINDGYTDIIEIAHKESGIKLKEEERLGLTEMKAAIDKGGVDVVYAWEISRIARTKKVLFSIESYLVEHGVQLIIKDVNLRLLNADGSINDAAEMAFTLWAQMAESEMRTKAERFKRGKKQKAREGKYSGGYVPFGYAYDDDRNFYVVEHEAVIIRRIFDLYESGLTITAVAEQLQREGHAIKFSFVAKALKNRNYTGELYRHRAQVNARLYPQIISADQFDRCRAIAEGRLTVVGKGRNVYLAKGLVRCPSCGSLWTASGSRTCYSCYEAKQGRRGFEAELSDRVKCDNTASISINVLDSLLWHVALATERESPQNLVVSESLYKAFERIEALKGELAEVEKKKKALFRAWHVDGMIDEAEYTALRDELLKRERNIQLDIKTAERRTEVLSEQTREYGEVPDDADDATMYALVHKHIESVDITPIEWQHEFGSGLKWTRGKRVIIHRFADRWLNRRPLVYIHLPYDGHGGRTILNADGTVLDYALMRRFFDPHKEAAKAERARKKAERRK